MIESPWRPMTEHVFPWPHRDMIVMAFDVKSEGPEIFRCVCAEHGAIFPKRGGMLSLHEEGWVPFAWRVDDAPERDDDKWPPLWTDYLMAPEEQDHLVRPVEAR